MFSLSGSYICTSASGEVASVTGQLFEQKKVAAGDTFEVGSKQHSVHEISVGGGLGSIKILVGAEKISVQSGGNLDGRLLAGVLMFVLFSMLVIVSRLLTTFRKPLQSLVPAILSINFTDPDGIEPLASKGPAEVVAVTTAVNQLVAQSRETIAGLRKDRAATESRVAKIAELIRVSDGAFGIFLGKTRGFIESCKHTLAGLDDGGDARDAGSELMRLTHTIKSNAKLFSFRHIHDVAKELEEFLSSVLHHPNPDRSFGRMVGSYVELIEREVEGYRELRQRIFPNHDEEETRDRERLFSLSHEPMIVEGVLDPEGAASAIEFCLVRKLARLTQTETALPGLGAA